jgi:hypothetical protein
MITTDVTAFIFARSRRALCDLAHIPMNLYCNLFLPFHDRSDHLWGIVLKHASCKTVLIYDCPPCT